MAQPKKTDPVRTKSSLHCSFCAKSQDSVEALVAGPGVFICNECTDMANSIIAKHQTLSEDEARTETSKGKDQRTAFLEGKQTEDLLELLVNVERTRKSIDSHQQILVDLLRGQRIRWAEIGTALGVTRQAAWQRFSAAD